MIPSRVVVGHHDAMHEAAVSRDTNSERVDIKDKSITVSRVTVHRLVQSNLTHCPVYCMEYLMTKGRETFRVAE